MPKLIKRSPEKPGLSIAKEHGVSEVLLNINDKNTVSDHFCEKLGG